MISIHPDVKNIEPRNSWAYARGFEWVECRSLDDVASLITRRCWCPGKYEGGHRRSDKFEKAELIGLDFDNGVCNLLEAVNRFSSYAHIIGTTMSHQVEKEGLRCDRFRVVLLLTAGVSDMKLFKNTMKTLVQENPESDQKPKDAGRFFYPCREIISMRLDGRRVAPVPEAEHRPKPRDYSLEKEFKNVPTWVRAFLGYGVPEGMRNDTVLRISKTLTKCGFSFDEIFDMVQRSPISLPQEELQRVIQNGRNYGKASS